MKITVLNGSPKSDKNSITMQYIYYIQKKYPQHEINIINVGLKLRNLRIKDEVFKGIIDEVRGSDGVIWGFPLYFASVCAQYKRFIELIWEKGVQDAFKDKYAVAISTSIHFFDHTAINYIHMICDDLKMRYFGGASPEMYDLMHRKERKRWSQFMDSFFNAMENNIPTPISYSPLKNREFTYNPIESNLPSNKINLKGKKILILNDLEEENSNQEKMMKRFMNSFQQNPISPDMDSSIKNPDIEVVNLHEIDIKGGCIGCIKCGYDNKCFYEGQDGFFDFFEGKVKKADIIVFVSAIKDRYLSYRIKLFYDRSFYNGHTPSLEGKQLIYLISGPLSQIENLKEMLHGIAGIGHANIVDIITDEFGDSKYIDSLIQNVAEKALSYSDMDYRAFPDFREVGGYKIFRDAIYGGLRIAFFADHRFYKKHGVYDTFPQKNKKGNMRHWLMEILMKSGKFRKVYDKKFMDGMMSPFKILFERMEQHQK